MDQSEQPQQIITAPAPATGTLDQHTPSAEGAVGADALVIAEPAEPAPPMLTVPVLTAPIVAAAPASGAELAEPATATDIAEVAEVAPEPAEMAQALDGAPADGEPTESAPLTPAKEAPDAPITPPPPAAAPTPDVTTPSSRLPMWHVTAWHVAAWHLALPRLPRRAVLLVMLVLIVALAGVGALEAVDAAGQVRQARQLATDGMQHLERAQALIDPNQPATLLNSTILSQAQRELTAAQRDFAALRATLAQPHGSLALGSHLPWAGSLLSSTAALAAAADEACQGGLALLEGGQIAARVAQGGALASSAKPAPNTLPLNTDTFNHLRTSLTTGWGHLESAITYARQADLAALPSWLLKPSQRAQLRTLLARWPQIQDTYTQAQAVLDVLPTALGLNGPSRYLIELMDRTELRAGGGFVGNYAVMTIQDGKVQPFTLTDTYLLDRPYLAKHPAGVAVPSQYSWWPWSDIFGLRDSNLSPDFPTSARLGMQQLTREGGPSVQGVIALTPAVIEGILHIIGPVSVPQYHQIVTEHNLEHLIHHYQLIPANNNPLVALPPNEQISSTAKRFTALLGQAFMEKLRGLSLDKELAIGKQMLDSLHTKDIQFYLSDPHAEALLAKYHADGALPRGSDDGVTVIDSNVTPSKGSQFMTILTKDAVTLDTTGTATHQVTITYQFKVTNPAELYGPTYYRSYLRVYAPATARLIARQGLTNLGGHDQIGHSDLSGHQMWGGYVIIQNGHPYTLHFTWQVPKAATALAGGRHAYTVIYSRQAGAQQRLDVTVSAPGKSSPAAKYAGPLLSDTALTLSY